MLDEDVVTSPLNELHGRAKHGFRRALREMVVMALLAAVALFVAVEQRSIMPFDAQRSVGLFVLTFGTGLLICPVMWLAYKLVRFIIGR